MAISDHAESIIGGGEMRSEAISQGTDTMDHVQDHSLEKFQQSVFSLTLDEIQTKSGMDFGDMNMDELLNTVVSSDDFQISSTFERDPPYISVPTRLSEKSVEEIWLELQDNNQPEQDQGGFDFSRPMAINETLSLGEMTLEDFLIKAGVVKPPSPPLPISLNDNPSVGSFFSNGASAFNGPSNIAETGYNNNMGVNVGPVMMGCEISAHASCVYGNGINILKSDGSSVFNSPSNTIETGYNNKRKQVPEVETSAAAEQRHKRTIKNRESAARSRARKQAYTSALEKELKHHKAENARLKLSLEESEKKFKQEKEFVKKFKQEVVKKFKQEVVKKFKQEGGEKDSEMKGSLGPLRKTKSASW